MGLAFAASFCSWKDASCKSLLQDFPLMVLTHLLVSELPVYGTEDFDFYGCLSGFLLKHLGSQA